MVFHFIFFWIICVVLDMQLCMYNIWGCSWNSGKWSVFVAPPPHHCHKSALTFRPQRYFLFPWIERNAHHSARLFLSHPSKAVAQGGSVKNVISNHTYMCLLSVVLGFSSGLSVWLYYENYNRLNPTLHGLCSIIDRFYVQSCHSGFFFS